MRTRSLISPTAFVLLAASALVCGCDAIADDNARQPAALSGSGSGVTNSPAEARYAVLGPFRTSYQGFAWLAGDRQPLDCSRAFEIVYYRPDTPGTHPLYVYTVGTSSDHDAADVHTHFLREMAARGFVAASIQYDNYDVITSGCTYYDRKASCIYSSTRQDSALRVLGALPFADASRVVTGGHSQGGHIAILAGNWTSAVRAAQPTGTAPMPGRCLESFSLGRDRIRVVNGEHEDRHSCGLPWLGCYTTGLACNRPTLQSLSQLVCGPTDTSCLRANGSGWVFALDQHAPPCAAHSYFKDAAGTRADWTVARGAWGRDANLQWLATMAFR